MCDDMRFLPMHCDKMHFMTAQCTAFPSCVAVRMGHIKTNGFLCALAVIAVYPVPKKILGVCVY